MKYMILIYGSQRDFDAMSGRPGVDAAKLWSPEDLQRMFEFMGELNEELIKNGELVDAQGLGEPALSRRVQFKDGQTVVTDGPYSETKEVVAGYWVVDVEGLDRATEIAAKAATCPGPGGTHAGGVVDIRPIMEAPTEPEA